MALTFVSNEFRDFEFTGNPGLTEATSCNRDPVFFIFVPSDNSIAVIGTFVLIVPFCRDRPGWTAGRAGSAGFVEVVKAIGPAIGIDLFRSFEG
jgi:hypothetical protein